jgi:tetratricopeptide (TPR) repeat protein
MHSYHCVLRAHLLSLLVIAFALSANAQYPLPFGDRGSEPATVRGVIQNTAIGSHLVVELDSAIGSHGGFRSDVAQQGSFTFMSVPQGQYILKVMDFYGTVIHREFVEVNQMVGGITVRLPEMKRETGRGGTVSVQRLMHKIPKEARKEFERAEKAAGKGDNAQSIAHLKKAVQIDPEYFEAYVNLGVRYLREENADEALRSFEQALKIDESNSIAYSNTASALLLLDRFGDAEKAARRSLEIDPGNPRARYMLGLALIQQQKSLPEAVENLQRVCDSFPYARVAVAHVFAKQGKTDEAKGELNAYLKSGRPENRDQVKTFLANLNAR